jgi:hypothetical protein
LINFLRYYLFHSFGCCNYEIKYLFINHRKKNTHFKHRQQNKNDKNNNYLISNGIVEFYDSPLAFSSSSSQFRSQSFPWSQFNLSLVIFIFPVIASKVKLSLCSRTRTKSLSGRSSTQSKSWRKKREREREKPLNSSVDVSEIYVTFLLPLSLFPLHWATSLLLMLL